VKILLLNQTFHPDVAATAQYLAQVAQGLVQRGHLVSVVASRRAYDHPETTFSKTEQWQGVRIHRVGSTGFGKAAKWRRGADFASFLFLCCLKLATLPRHDVVVALTSPPLISFLGAWLARFKGSRFVYWVMDFNPDEAIAAGWLKADSFAGRMLARMSRFSLRRADRIIALDRFMRDRIQSKGIAPEKISVIPPWSHDDHVRFDAGGRESFRARHGLQDKFVVMYSGNHSPIHPLDTLLAAAERLQGDPSLAFCFVGGGSEFERVKRWAAEGNHRNVVCLPYQPLDQLSASLSAADAHAVVMGNAFVGLVHPCKIYNILSVAAPVLYIGPRPSHLSEILAGLDGEHPCAVAGHGEVEKVVQQIVHWQKHWQPRREIPTRVLSRFSKKSLLPRVMAAIEAGGDANHSGAEPENAASDERRNSGLSPV